MRLLALLLLIAVLPTAELTEQAVHVVEHVLAHDLPDHSAHHGGEPGDEHGCTGLVHLCGHHMTQITASHVAIATATIETPKLLAASAPSALVDLNALEPPHRPPIA